MSNIDPENENNLLLSSENISKMYVSTNTTKINKIIYTERIFFQRPAANHLIGSI